MVRENSVRGFLGRAVIGYSGGVGGCGWWREVRFFPVKMITRAIGSFLAVEIAICWVVETPPGLTATGAPLLLLVSLFATSRSTQEDLRIPFEQFGAITDIYLPKNYYTGLFRSFRTMDGLIQRAGTLSQEQKDEGLKILMFGIVIASCRMKGWML